MLNRLPHLIRPTLGISFVLILVSCAYSQDLSSARIVSKSDPVQISRVAGGRTVRVDVQYGTQLYPGDVIKTGSTGRLVIGLSDGSQATISRNTIVEIGNVSTSPRTIFKILRGKTRIKIEKLGGKPNPYRVTTPTTVISVRGTIFDVTVRSNETRVFVIEGEVGVFRIDFPDAEVILVPGQFTEVKGKEPPRAPASFKPGRNDEFFSNLPSNATDRGRFGNSPGWEGGFPGDASGNPRAGDRNSGGNRPGGLPGNSGATPANSSGGTPANAGPGRRGKP